MKEIHYTQIVAAVRNLCIKANTVLPQDLCSALRAARTADESPVGQALIGCKVGDHVEVETQAGVMEYEVLHISRSL